jgi:ribosomal protein L37AE/L43A
MAEQVLKDADIDPASRHMSGVVMTQGMATNPLVDTGMLTRSFKTNREHVKHVNHIVNEKKKENTCLKCGSPMVLRETKNGVNAGKQFWGCSSFPKCKGVLNIT